jgi:hypothetical protein
VTPLVSPVGVPLTEEDARKLAQQSVYCGWEKTVDSFTQALLSVDVASREQAQKEARELVGVLLLVLRRANEHLDCWIDTDTPDGPGLCRPEHRCAPCRVHEEAEAAIKAAESYLG